MIIPILGFNQNIFVLLTVTPMNDFIIFYIITISSDRGISIDFSGGGIKHYTAN